MSPMISAWPPSANSMRPPPFGFLADSMRVIHRFGQCGNGSTRSSSACPPLSFTPRRRAGKTRVSLSTSRSPARRNSPSAAKRLWRISPRSLSTIIRRADARSAAGIAATSERGRSYIKSLNCIGQTETGICDREGAKTPAALVLLSVSVPISIYLRIAFLQERRKEIDRHGKNRGRILFGGDLDQALEKTELQRHRACRHDIRRFLQLLRCLELSLGVDDFGAPLALGLGLLRHRALHLLRQVDVFDRHLRDLDAPGIGMLVDNRLQIRVDLFALRQNFVELGLAADAPERRLR